MNKLILPTILVATVLVVAVFSIIPVDKATTIHNQILAGMSGVSAVETKSVTSTSSDMEADSDIFHWFILKSDKPYTIHDITVKAEVVNGTHPFDTIEVEVFGYPAEYGNDPKGAQSDSRDKDILDDTSTQAKQVIGGSHDGETSTGQFVSENPQTWSLTRADADQSTGPLTFAAATNILVQVEFRDFSSGASANEFTAMVTFHLRGVSADDVSITLVEDQEEVD